MLRYLMPDSQRNPWKLCLIKYELYIDIYIILKTENFQLFLYKIDLPISTAEEHQDIILLY